MFQTIAAEILFNLPTDSDCQKDIDALGAASKNVPGAKPIDNGSLAEAITEMNAINGLTATAPASTLNDPEINSGQHPNIANAPISDLFKIRPGSQTINEALAQRGGNNVYFRPAFVLILSANAGAGLVRTAA